MYDALDYDDSMRRGHIFVFDCVRPSPRGNRICVFNATKLVDWSVVIILLRSN